jgi:ribosomal subunit interface protein
MMVLAHCYAISKESLMQVSIEGHQTDIQPELRERITQRLEALNVPHEDIVHARVALEKDTHHQQGADEVRVILALSGKMLTAKKTATNIYDAANAALETIERELKEFRDQRRGVLKAPGPRIRGRIIRIFRERGYGFVETETYQEVYFHANSVHGIRFEELQVGMTMDLEIEAGQKGPQASQMTPHLPSVV